MTSIRGAPIIATSGAVVLALAVYVGADHSGGFSLLSANIIDVDILSPSVAQSVLPDVSCGLPGAIANGRAMLRSSPPLDAVFQGTKRIRQKDGTVKTVSTGDIVRRQIALAVLDTVTCTVFERRYWLDEKDMARATTARRLYLPNTGNLPEFVPAEADDKYSVFVNWWNSYNSDLTVLKQGESSNRYVVVANKYLLPNGMLVFPEDRTGDRYSDIVASPYSFALHRPELVRAGREFLNSVVEKGFDRLREMGIRSRAFPGKLVTDTITPAFVKHLFLTEQTDPTMMFNSDDKGQRLSERVLVLLGANKEKAFRYTYSRTSALGLGQHMPATYALVVRGYPEARLIKDRDIGRADIQNAVIGTILILDDHLATALSGARASKKAMAIFEKKTPDEVDEVRAAIYNGGPGKYQEDTGTISQRIRETVDFVKKFRMIRALGLFADAQTQ